MALANQSTHPSILDFHASGIDENGYGYLVAAVAYAAPEMLKGEPAVAASDIYGISITLAAAVIGRSPFRPDVNTCAATVIERVLAEYPHDIVEAPVSGEFIEVLLSGLAKEPANRPATVLEFQFMLREATTPICGPSLITDPVVGDPNDIEERMSGVDHDAVVVSPTERLDISNPDTSDIDSSDNETGLVPA